MIFCRLKQYAYFFISIIKVSRDLNCSFKKNMYTFPIAVNRECVHDLYYLVRLLFAFFHYFGRWYGYGYLIFYGRD